MKVLMLNGSSRAEGNTYTALAEIGRQLREEGIEYEIVQIGSGPVRDCIACQGCNDKGCVFTDDGVNDFVQKAREADGFVFGTPVYYAHSSGSVLSFLNRVFYSSSDAFAYKPGAAVAVARRAGTTSAFSELNRYFTISNMLVVGSSYWNVTFGRQAGETVMDAEGLRTMRNLARNMAWLLKCIESGKKSGVALPETERGEMTDFIR